MRFWRSKWVRTLFLGLGLGFLVFFIDRLGLHNVVAHLKKMKYGILWPIIISAVWYIFNCLAWEQFLIARRDKISLWRMCQIKVAGEAVNTATPVSWAGGDPVRIAMMRPFLCTSEGATSVILDRTIHSATTFLMMGAGIFLALATFNLPEPLRYGLIATILLGGVMLATTILHQHRGLLSGLLSVADRLYVGRFIGPGARDKMATIDAQIQTFYATEKPRFFLATFYHVVGRLLGVLEIYVIAIVLNTPISPLHAYLLAMLAAIINFIFVLIPGGMGVMEGAYGGLYHLINLDPAAGVALQLVRRLRSFFWIGVGFLVIAAASRSSRREPTKL